MIDTDDELFDCNCCGIPFYHFDYFRAKDDLLCYHCIEKIDAYSRICGYLFIFNRSIL